MELLRAVQQVNNDQPMRLFNKVLDHFEGVIAGRPITVWGLAFKSGTDDLRETPALPLIGALVGAGAQVTAYDPQTNGAIRNLLGDEIFLSDDQYQSLSGSEALIVATDWDEFREADLLKMRRLMIHPLIFDGRNVYSPEVMRELGFRYFGVGRPHALEGSIPSVAEILG